MTVAQLLREARTVVVAEACDNHFGSLDRAFALLDAAHAAGAQVVKFQHHIPDEEMLEDIPLSDNFDEPLWSFLQRCALSIDDHAALIERASRTGITYLCTPFSIAAAEELHALGQREFKVGSGELRDLPFLDRLSELADHLILSTGMSTPEEIDDTVTRLRARVQLTIMNCTSAYPTRHEDAAVGFVAELRRRYPDLTIGQSDHTPDNYTCFAAVALGARIVEKHFTLDRGLGGPDASVSIEPDELADLVRGCAAIDAAMNDDKRVRGAEAAIRSWAYRSVVTKVDVGAGETLTTEHIATKRPGTGIPATRFSEVLGRRTSRAIAADTLVGWDDLEPETR